MIELRPIEYVNDTRVIRQNPPMVAINGALQVDLTGQVCADSLGHQVYSGPGGQMDFMRGTALSPVGKPIIALSSTAAGGSLSRIVTGLTAGAGDDDHAGARPLRRHRVRDRVPAGDAPAGNAPPRRSLSHTLHSATS